MLLGQFIERPRARSRRFLVLSRSYRERERRRRSTRRSLYPRLLAVRGWKIADARFIPEQIFGKIDFLCSTRTDGIEITGWNKLVEIIQLRGRFLEIVFLLAGDEVGAGEGFLDPSWLILLMRGEDFRVTVHVTIAASWHFENVHVQAQLVVPRQKPVIIVHLGAGRTIIFGYESAARLWIPEKWNF